MTAVPNSATVSNIVNTSFFATRFARRRTTFDFRQDFKAEFAVDFRNLINPGSAAQVFLESRCLQNVEHEVALELSMNPNFKGSLEAGSESNLRFQISPPTSTLTCLPGTTPSANTKGGRKHCEMNLDVNIITLAAAVNRQLERAREGAAYNATDILAIKTKHFSATGKYSKVGRPRWISKKFNSQTHIVFAPEFSPAKQDFSRKDYQRLHGPSSALGGDFAYIVAGQNLFLPTIRSWNDDCNEVCSTSALYSECENIDLSLEMIMYPFAWSERTQVRAERAVDVHSRLPRRI